MAINAALFALLTAALAIGPMPVSEAAPLAALTQTSFVKQWQQGPFTQDKGAPIAESSPMVATLDGQGRSVVVGDRSGNLYAFHLSNGSAVPGWPVNDGGPPIDSTPSVSPLEGSAMLGGSALGSVFVGAGNAEYPDEGGYLAYGPNGAPLWGTTRLSTQAPTPTPPTASRHRGPLRTYRRVLPTCSAVRWTRSRTPLTRRTVRS